jgi:histidinol-phosphate aminotransferase
MYYVNPTIKDFIRINQPEGRLPYIRLDQNENPDGVPQWLFDEAMKKVTPEYLSLYPEEIAFTEKYANHLGVNPGNVTFTVGSVVAMGYAIKVFGEPGKNLISVTPTFGMYKVYADMEHVNTKFIPYEKDFTFDINKMLNAIDEQTTIVSIVNPTMPIGNVFTQEEIEKVVLKAQKHRAMVIIDEAYYYFYKETSLELIKKYDNVIILRTFSKMFSIPALRMGVVISNEKNVQYIKNYKPHYTVNGVALAFAETMLDNFDRLILELDKKFTTGRDYLLQELKKRAYHYIPSHGCFICITPKHKTAEYITEELKKRNILIFCGKGDSAGFLRVTIWDKKYMEAFMHALEEIDT